jgi:hypothetical protein
LKLNKAFKNLKALFSLKRLSNQTMEEKVKPDFKLFFILSKIQERFSSISDIEKNSDCSYTFNAKTGTYAEDGSENKVKVVAVFDYGDILFNIHEEIFSGCEKIKSFRFYLNSAYNDPSELRKLAGMLKSFARNTLDDIIDAEDSFPDFQGNITEWEKNMEESRNNN